MVRWRITVLALASLLIATAASAQYFGRNKVQFRTFDFQLLQTDHFDLYYYPEEKAAADVTARMAERWYTRLSKFFGHELRGRQTVILYAVPAHFQQTNAVDGIIGEGTGGVTESLHRRVVLPVGGSLADTDHVLGHELVHAFQFDITGADPHDLEPGAPGILAFPLWYVEGMAEYLSLGPIDGQTAMWMRDAALREKLPNIKDLEDPKYFPYRWGHAFWAYIGAKYGDRAVASLIRSAANPRFDLPGLARQLGTDATTLNDDWHHAIVASTRAVAAALPSLASEPRLTIPHDDQGRYNIGPRLSPDGKSIAFFSSRDLFSIDLYLADAESGKVVRRLVRSATNPHFDSIQFINSAGAWSPDGRTLAVAAIGSGKPLIALVDVKDAKVAREIPLAGLDDAVNPSYSPDGRSIVFGGNQGGLLDLYLLEVATGRLERLTNDPFADLEPTFTPDGKSVVFVTERYTTDLATLQPGALRLAKVDVATKTVTPIMGFLQGKHISPQVSADGTTVTFIADPDGVSNLYRMPVDGGPIVQVSAFATGVAGITASSPALSASSTAGRMAFSVFENDGESIYVLDEAKVIALVAPEVSRVGAILPGRTVASASGDVQRFLSDANKGLPTEASKPASQPYKRRLVLDQLGQPVVSATVGQFGSQVSGSMSAAFSDVLGDVWVGVAGQVGGSLSDFGGQLYYLNRRHRWNWATVVSADPYRIGYLRQSFNPANKTTTISEVIERQNVRGGMFTAARPFNRTTRVEFSAAGRALSFTRETRNYTFASNGRDLLDQTTVHETTGQPLYLGEGGVALVHDTSFYGATSPIYGGRYRFEFTRTGGTLNYTGILLDWRRYYMPRRPITIAVRAIHMGRYGTDSEHPQLVPLYVGYPEFLHGYGYGSFSPADCQSTTRVQQCEVFSSLIGSRMFAGNIEIRAPLAGLIRGRIDYGRVPVEVAAFMDSAVAWSSGSFPALKSGEGGLLRSIGGAARINAFGFFIIEVAASRPLDRIAGGWQWQVGLRQGF